MRRATPRQIVVGLALVVVLAVIVGVALTVSSPPGRQADDPPAVQPTTGQPAVTPSASPTSPTRSPSAAGRRLTDGIYEVGTEIPAGTYSTTAGDRPCYWARLRSFGQADSIIDDRNLDPGESARVVVRPTDRGFKVSNGCTWQAELAM